MRTAANSFLEPNHFSTVTVFLLGMYTSTAKCLKVRDRDPSLPVILMVRELTLAVTPLGILTLWLVLIVLILVACLLKDKQSEDYFDWHWTGQRATQ